MIIIASLTISAAVLASTGCGKTEPSKTPAPHAATPAPPALPTPQATVPATAKPRMIDLGAKKCIPCKMMAPILEDLMKNYTDHFETVFIDVWENTAAGKHYGIKTIPTQIFFDAHGKELFRHEGFISKEDILKKWAELGVPVSSPK